MANRRTLHQAVRYGSLSDVTQFLVDHSDIDILGWQHDCNALQLAIGRGSFELFQLLFDFTNKNKDALLCVDKRGNTLVHLVCLKNNTQRTQKQDSEDSANDTVLILRLLLEQGVSPAIHNFDGLAAIHLAVLDRQFRLVWELLISSPDLITCCSMTGRTALHYAVAMSDNMSLLQHLLAVQACPVNYQDCEGCTALHVCLENAEWSLCYALELLKNGAHTDIENARQNTVIVSAVLHGNAKLVKILLENGADCNVCVHEQHLRSLLSLAIVNGETRTAELLIGWPAMNINLQAANGKTALHYCVQKQCLAQVRALLEAGANPNICDIRNVSPLLLAIEVDNIEICKLLIDSGADVHIRDNNGSTLLHYAAKQLVKADGTTLQLLLQSDVQLDAIDLQGWHAFHVAMFDEGVGDLHLCNPLVRSSAEALATAAGQKHRNNWPQSTDGSVTRSPLYRAVQSGHSNWVELLCQYDDTNVNVVDDVDQRSALAACCEMRSGLHFEAIFKALIARHDLMVNAGIGAVVTCGQVPLLNLLTVIDQPVEVVYVAARQLLEHGADPNLCEGRRGADEEQSPHAAQLLLATFRGHTLHLVRLLLLLLAHGAVVRRAAGVLLTSAADHGDVAVLQAALTLVVGVYPHRALRQLSNHLMNHDQSSAQWAVLAAKATQLAGRLPRLTECCRLTLRASVMPRPSLCYLHRLPLPSKLINFLLMRSYWKDLVGETELC